MRDILHKVSQIFPDMLKFVDSGILYIVRMQNFVDQFGLRHDFRDVRHRCNSGNLLKQVAAGFAVFLSDEIGKLNAVYQRIEPHRLSIVFLRRDERCQLLPHEQGVLIGHGVIVIGICIQLHIFQVLAHCKVLFVQFLHFVHHVLYQRLAEGNEIRCLIRQVLQFERNLGFQMEDRSL